MGMNESMRIEIDALHQEASKVLDEANKTADAIIAESIRESNVMVSEAKQQVAGINHQARISASYITNTLVEQQREKFFGIVVDTVEKILEREIDVKEKADLIELMSNRI